MEERDSQRKRERERERERESKHSICNRNRRNLYLGCTLETTLC